MYFTYNNIYSPYNNNNNNNNNRRFWTYFSHCGYFGIFPSMGGILVVFYVSGVFWSFLGFGECFGCYNLLINNNIINTSNYVNIF